MISFEFFPPKDENGERALLEDTIPALRQVQADFCSVTCGAGGSTTTYQKTLETLNRARSTMAIVGNLTAKTGLPFRSVLKSVPDQREGSLGTGSVSFFDGL